MFKKHNLILAGLSLLTAMACTRTLSLDAGSQNLGDGVTVSGSTVSSPVIIEGLSGVNLNTGEGFTVNEAETKSALGSIDNLLTSLVVSIYESGEENAGKKPVRMYWFNKMSEISFELPSWGKEYDIYLFGNIFEQSTYKSILGNYTRAQMDQWKYTVDDYSSFATKGLPMANVYRNYSLTNAPALNLRRLTTVVKLVYKNPSEDFIFDKSSFKCVLQHCPNTVTPFAPMGSMATDLDEVLIANNKQDRFLSADIDKFLAGEPVYLYLLENRQTIENDRVVSPFKTKVTVPKDKEPGNAKNGDVLSYFEISCDYILSGEANKGYINDSFRFCLGKDVYNNCDVERNHILLCEVQFGTELNNTGWYVGVEDEEVLYDFTLNKNTFSVIGNIEDELVLTVTKNKLGQNVELEVVYDDKEAAEDAEVSTSVLEYDATNLKLHFKTTYPIVGLYTGGNFPPLVVTGSVQTKKKKTNGEPIASKPFTLNVYRALFPIYVVCTGSTDGNVPTEFHFSAYNPMKLGLDITVEEYDQDDNSVTVSKNEIYARGEMPGPHGTVNKFDEALSTYPEKIINGFASYHARYRYNIIIKSAPEYPNSFPRIAEGKTMYMGENSKCEIGPGPNYYPKKMEFEPVDEVDQYVSFYAKHYIPASTKSFEPTYLRKGGVWGVDNRNENMFFSGSQWRNYDDAFWTNSLSGEYYDNGQCFLIDFRNDNKAQALCYLFYYGPGTSGFECNVRFPSGGINDNKLRDFPFYITASGMSVEDIDSDVQTNAEMVDWKLKSYMSLIVKYPLISFTSNEIGYYVYKKGWGNTYKGVARDGLHMFLKATGKTGAYVGSCVPFITINDCSAWINYSTLDY